MYCNRNVEQLASNSRTSSLLSLAPYTHLLLPYNLSAPPPEPTPIAELLVPFLPPTSSNPNHALPAEKAPKTCSPSSKPLPSLLPPRRPSPSALRLSADPPFFALPSNSAVRVPPRYPPSRRRTSPARYRFPRGSTLSHLGASSWICRETSLPASPSPSSRHSCLLWSTTTPRRHNGPIHYPLHPSLITPNGSSLHLPAHPVTQLGASPSPPCRPSPPRLLIQQSSPAQSSITPTTLHPPPPPPRRHRRT
ncbi:hypothetical protein BCR35DRAFT_308345 [Leucosporidium creatinivorum]|uniref:Uncharacterized protein n=1 Tax=Leucosporidium creatinivorum TaxID=106004 RepID=A0A1Y2E9J0_9BASI|nr:hypothetical protein BCR35DRAFT_308345 [Leucosporidium creatinivorum]